MRICLRPQGSGVLLAAVLLGAASPLVAREAETPDRVCSLWASRPEATGAPTFLYDHARNAGFLVENGVCRALDRDEEVRVAGRIAVRVINTNTALYTFGMTQKKIDAPEIQDLKAFSKALGPYLVELGQGIFGPAATLRSPLEPAVAAPIAPRPQVQRIRELLYGPAASGGLHGILARIGKSLEEMRDLEARQALLAKSADPEKAGAEIDRQLGEVVARLKADLSNDAAFSEKEGDYRLGTIKALLAEFESLSDSEGAGGDAQVQKLFAAQSRLLDLAYEVEALGSAALTAETGWSLPKPVSLSAFAGRTLTLKVAPAASRDTGRVAGRGPKEFAFTAQPDWLVRPALGLGFVVAPDAVYPEYGTTKDGTGAKVVASGTQDSRFTYGLTLGATWRGLDDRARNGFAVWAPELIVNPSSDLKAFGIGVGVSWSVVKLGVGGLWTKHTSLNGQSPGQVLASADDLRLKEGYGPPKLFFSLSVFGWPPFVP